VVEDFEQEPREDGRPEPTGTTSSAAPGFGVGAAVAALAAVALFARRWSG